MPLPTIGGGELQAMAAAIALNIQLGHCITTCLMILH